MKTETRVSSSSGGCSDDNDDNDDDNEDLTLVILNCILPHNQYDT